MAEATKWTGEAVVLPEAGEVTVTVPARHAVVRMSRVMASRTASLTALSKFGFTS